MDKSGIQAIRLSGAQLRFLTGIGLLLGLRQFILLLALPMIALHAMALEGGSALGAGLALGVYGLLQGLLQVPFGRLSDRFGRKALVLAGTVLMIGGLVVAAVATDIATFVFGRALQGAGAIAGVAIAWVSDGVPEGAQNRAMGASSAAVAIGAIASFLAGPLLYATLPLPQIFLICAGLGVLILAFVVLAMPGGAARPSEGAGMPVGAVLRIAGMGRLLAAGFLLNYVLMAFVFLLPLAIDEAIGGRAMWTILVPATLIGIVVMRYAVRHAERGRQAGIAALGFAAFLPAALCLSSRDPLLLGVATTLFMAAYLSLMALLSAASARVAGPASRGIATGAFQSTMFFGAFAGGAATGLLWPVGPWAALAALAAAAVAGAATVVRSAESIPRS